MSDLILSHGREKLIQSIIFFGINTEYCGETKLFKLLYFLDFEHFLETGRSVTELDYYAWKMGPVPRTLRDEIESPKTDFSEKISFKRIKTRYSNHMKLVIPKTEFDPTHFSKREIGILYDLVKQYKNTQSNEMIEKTHFENLPWHKVYNEQGKRLGKIPYEYALRKSETELMQVITDENTEIYKNYK